MKVGLCVFSLITAFACGCGSNPASTAAAADCSPCGPCKPIGACPASCLGPDAASDATVCPDASPSSASDTASDATPVSDTGQDATPSTDIGPDVPDTTVDAGPGFTSSKGGCAPWFGQGCGGCACEKAVCADTPECCSTLWGQACALECADKGGPCTTGDVVGDGGKDAGTGDTGPFACEVKYEGAIPGAKLDLSKTPCVFSISQAGGTFALPYDVIVKAATPLWNTDPNAGQCPPQNVFGGVATFVTLEGLGDGTPQKWCLCDVGLCAPPKDISYTATTPGTYTHAFTWDGKNFQGPSDTNQQPGAPFPPGQYTLTVKSQGLFQHADGAEDAYTATATLQILLQP